MTESHRIKTQLRSTLQQRRRTLSPSAQHAAAQALTDAVVNLPNWASAQRIALYLSADGEIDTKPLEKMARDLGKQLFLPVINSDNSLSFAHWHADDIAVKQSLQHSRAIRRRPPLRGCRAAYHFFAAGGLGSAGAVASVWEGDSTIGRCQVFLVHYWLGWPTTASGSMRSRRRVGISGWITLQPMPPCTGARENRAKSAVNYCGMMMPACNSDAGPATESFAARGTSNVSITPRTNAAARTNTKSGLRFTDCLSLTHKQGYESVESCTHPRPKLATIIILKSVAILYQA